MGYCSEVGLILKVTDYITMTNFTADPDEYDMGGMYAEDLLTNFVDKAFINKRKEIEFITLKWNWIKWYGLGPDWIMHYLEEHEIPYLFSRVGESSAEIDGENVYCDDDYDLSDFMEVETYIRTEGKEITIEEIWKKQEQNFSE